jgi:hypothetical protein
VFLGGWIWKSSSTYLTCTPQSTFDTTCQPAATDDNHRKPQTTTHTEPEEVRHLGRGVDLCLPSVLSLTQHGRGHQLEPVLAGDEIGSLQEDGRLVRPRHILPSLLSLDARLDGLGEQFGGGRVGVGEVALVVVGEDLGEGVAGSDLLTVDDTGDVEGELGLHLGDGSLEVLSVARLHGVGPLCRQEHVQERGGQRSVSGKLGFLQHSMTLPWVVGTHHGLIVDDGDLEAGELSVGHFERVCGLNF